MLAIRENYITDIRGKRKQVILDMKDYQKILDELEELESIRAYDKAMNNLSNEEIISFEQAVREIALSRK
jgi:hypothetical protein